MKKLAVTRLPRLALPDVILPVTAKLVKVPVLVIFGCAAVVSEPATVVNTPAAAPIFPTLALPVTLNAPVDIKLPPVIFAVAVNVFALITFTPEIFPPEPVVLILPNVPLPVATT